MINDYKKAANTRSRGILGNITDQLVAGNSIGGSIKGGISDTFKAKMTGIKEKFDPINIAQTFTGNLGGALVGKMLGRSTSDIAHFTGIKLPGTTAKDSVSTSFFATVTRNSNLKRGESLSDVAAKLFAFMKKVNEDKVKQYELDKDFEEEKEVKVKRRRKEIIQAIKEYRDKQIPEKLQEEPKAKKPEVKKPTIKNKEPVASPKEPPAVNKATKAVRTKKTTTPPKTTSPVTPPAAPTSPAVPAVSTAAKVAVGGAVAVTAGISSAAQISIERETGHPANQAIKHVGQIVPDDPKPGVTSYGVFGINSQGSVQSFVAENPQLGLTGKPASKEFDDQWKKVSTEKPQEMLQAQLRWYDNNVAKPLKNEITKIIPPQFVNDERVIAYLSDRRVQYGRTMEQQALSYAAKAKTPIEFISLMSEFDLGHLNDAFKTYLSNHPKAIEGLKNRIKEREKASLAQPVNKMGDKLSNSSVKNQELKQETTTNNIIVNNSVNSIQGGTINQQMMSTPSKDILPTYMAQ